MSATYWETQLDEFRQFLARNPNLDYRDWQPTKWQSLLGLRDRLVRECGLAVEGSGEPAHNAIVELGCGSATLLIQLASLGFRCVGIDRSESALKLAHAAAESIRPLTTPTFVCRDFLHEPFPHLDCAGLVFSIGTIEHYSPEQQLRILDIHQRLSSRWVMIGLPNLESPVFNSFIAWAERAGQLYPEDHVRCSIPELAQELGMHIRLLDGCHLFLGKAEYLVPGFPDLDRFYSGLKQMLVSVGGSRYEGFPHIDFGREDIEILSKVESLVPLVERIKFGFLNLWLLEKEQVP